MQNFHYSIPTEVVFGKGQLKHLGRCVKPYANRVLLVYGQASLKSLGIYDEILSLLSHNQIKVYELANVCPNPRIDSVREGVKKCRAHDIQMVLAVGGGSVIDCAKAIAAGVYYDGDPWDFFIRQAKIKKVLPIGTVLTLAATGSEMNGNAVISNLETSQKLAAYSDAFYPRFSILDPVYTMSVSRYQTAAGVVDIFTHILEQYFCQTKESFVQDRLAEALLKTCIFYGPIAIESPDNYDARANLMWASSLALNGLLSFGKIGDWATHQIEHGLSAFNDMTHGAGLSIIMPKYLRFLLEKIMSNDGDISRFVAYAKNIWGIDGGSDLEMAKLAIDKTSVFFTSLGMPSSFSDVGIQSSDYIAIAKIVTALGPVGHFQVVGCEDVVRVLQQ